MELLKLNPTEVLTLEQKKAQVWGNYGKALVKAEIDLQTKKMVLEKNLSITVTVENVKHSEEVLKAEKQALKAIFEARKTITDPIDGVKSRLMDVEKSANEIIKKFENSIIGVKKIIAEKQAKLNAKSDEQKLFLSKLNQAYIDLNDSHQQFINQSVSDLYLKILDSEVAFDDFDGFTLKLVDSLRTNTRLPDFKAIFERQNFKPTYNTMAELNELAIKNKKETIDVWESVQVNLLNKKVGYRSELANKEKAKELELKNQKEQEKQRLAEKQAKELEAKISQAQNDLAVEKPDVKALKKAYEIDMEDNHHTALLLFATFSSNLDLILPKLKVSKWFSFTPRQIANVLERLKTENNSIEFSGINFKIIEKL